MTKYYQTPFGNNVLVGSGGNVTSVVHNPFGPRKTGGAQGVNKVEGISEQLEFSFTGEDFAQLGDGLVPFVLPAGAVIREVYIDVEKVFALTGTTPTVLIGTKSSEVTNGFVISKAILEATNSARLTATLTGTWTQNTPIQANTQIGIALGGTTPTLSTTGKARITILFDRINRAPSPALAGGAALPS